MSAKALSPHGRTGLTNGKRLFLNEVDGRSLVARRFRDLVSDHMADLGGEANCSQAELAIVRRACTLIVILEQMESDFAVKGSMPISTLNEYGRQASTLRRLLESVGLKRRARDVGPPKLTDYIEGRANGAPRRVVRQ